MFLFFCIVGKRSMYIGHSDLHLVTNIPFSSKVPEHQFWFTKATHYKKYALDIVCVCLCMCLCMCFLYFRLEISL